jgi:hypothetical protein
VVSKIINACSGVCQLEVFGKQNSFDLKYVIKNEVLAGIPIISTNRLLNVRFPLCKLDHTSFHRVLDEGHQKMLVL